MLKLGGHGFDISRFLTGEEPEVVSAVVSRQAHGGDVEDCALATLGVLRGILFRNEVGYTMATRPANQTDGERKVAGSGCAHAACLILDGYRAAGVTINGGARPNPAAMAEMQKLQNRSIANHVRSPADWRFAMAQSGESQPAYVRSSSLLRGPAPLPGPPTGRPNTLRTSY
jgi:hypothetical protein